MAGILDPKTGLLTQAPEGTTINETGIVNRPITSPTQQTQPVQAIPTPNTRSQISETPQAGYIQGYDTNQNYKPVYVPKGVYVPGISPTPKEITTSSFQNQGTVKVPNIQTPEGQPDAMVAGGKATIESVMQEFSAPATQAQTMQSDFLSNIAGLTKELENKGVDQLSAEQSAGIPQLKTQFADINSQISTKLAEYNALQSQNKNRPVTMSSIIGSERAILDAKASDIGLLQAQAEGLRGQIQVAQETANRAVDLKYSTLEARLATYESQLRAIEPILSREEKQQAQAQQILLDRQKQEIADKKEKEKAIQMAQMAYFEAGGTDIKIANAISKAPTVEEAQRLAGMQVGKIVAGDRAMKQAEFALDSQYKQMQISNIRSEIANRGQQNQGYAPSEILAYAQQHAATGQVPTGLPKGSFGIVAQVAKELPKPNGALVSSITGIKDSKLGTVEQNDITKLYNIIENTKKLAELDKNRYKGLVAGTLGKIFGSNAQAEYLTKRQAIVDDIQRMQSGAALSETEQSFYQSYLPGRFAEPLIFGQDTSKKIANFQKEMESKLNNALSTNGLSIYGYSKVKVGDAEYKVGDIISNGEQTARVNPDGTLTLIQ